MATVKDLFETDSLKRRGWVCWGEEIPSDRPGVYVISMSSEFDQNNCLLDSAPIDHDLVSNWLRRAPEFKLDGMLNPSPEAVALRLGEYWLSDENILYIGQTSNSMRKRVNQFYRHKLGNRGGHSGGHWLKTLSVLRETFVHYAESPDAEWSEFRLMQAFMARVSASTKSRLRDSDRPYPFANVEFPTLRRQHGISKSKR